MGKLKMLSGLYFPGLQPDRIWTAALSPLVEQLVVYGVTEEGPAPGAPVTPWATRVVAPLGADARRFQALVREMTGREAAVIRGQLLAQASQSGRDRDEAHGWSLSSALHQMGDGSGEHLAKARAERLWQARLLLKLAETVSAAEAEIGLGLAQLAAKQAEMLKALQGGEDEGEIAESRLAASWPRPCPDRIFRLRDQLAAWAVFYLLDSAPEPLLLTDDPEAAALLADEVEKLAPGQVISLPVVDLGLGEKALAVVVKAVPDMLAGQVGAAQAALLALAESGRNARPADGETPMLLQLQLLPGKEFRQVMARLSGLPGEDGATALASTCVLVGAAAPGEAYR